MEKSEYINAVRISQCLSVYLSVCLTRPNQYALCIHVSIDQPTDQPTDRTEGAASCVAINKRYVM
jgi:hypothetical protein